MRARQLAFAAGVLAASGAVFACSSVLGFDTFTLEPSTSNNGEGGPGSEASSGDGNSGDCGDTVSSGDNCGRCGHSCLGGACVKSVCQPVMVASGLVSPEGITVDAQYIYVAEYTPGRIRKYDRSAASGAGEQPPFLDKDQGADFVTALGNDGTNLYWAVNATDKLPPAILSCALTGCSAQTVKTLSSFADPVFDNNANTGLLPLQLIVSKGRIFWGQSFDGAIASVGTDGLSPLTHLSAGTGTYAPVDLALDDDNIYFSTNGNGGASAQIFRVPRSAPATDTATLVVQGAARSWGIALGPDNNIYWATPFIMSSPPNGDGEISKVSSSQTGNGAGIVVAQSQQDPRMVLTDMTNVYWTVAGETDLASGMVLYCPIAGCPTNGPSVLAMQQNAPRHLAQDPEGLYWTNEGIMSDNSDGEVWKIAKP